MKNALLFFLLALLATTTAKAQTDFAPIGAEWYYGSTGRNFIHYYRFLSEKDTIVEGIECRKISGSYFSGEDTTKDVNIYVYASSDTVYYYNDRFSRFVPLYIFNVQEGDTLTYYIPSFTSGGNGEDTLFSVLVDRVTTIEVDGQPLKSVWTSPTGFEWGFIGNYMEKVGSTFHMFGPMFLAGTPESYEKSIRCYKDTQINYSIYTPCDDLPVTISPLNQIPLNISFYPNPSNGNFIINTESIYPDHGKIIITDLSGRYIHQLLISRYGQEAHEYSLALPAGIYILTYRINNVAYTNKLAIQP